MHHFSPQHRAELSSHSFTCRGAFTTTCGAGHKKFDNPQCEFIFTIPDDFLLTTMQQQQQNSSASVQQHRIETSLGAALSAAKLSFELRRFLPIASRRYSDSLGFSLVRMGASGASGGRISTRLGEQQQQQGEVIAHSTFQSNDVVTLTISASKLLGNSLASSSPPHRCRIIAVLYNSTPFYDADFQFSVIVSQPKRLADGIRLTLAEIASCAPSFIKQQQDNEEASPSPPPPQPPASSRPSQQRVDDDYNSDFDDDDDDDEDWIKPPPPLLEDDSSDRSSSGPSHCSEPLEDSEEQQQQQYHSAPTPAPPTIIMSDAEAAAAAAADKEYHLALTCTAARVLPERSLRFSGVAQMQGETGGGYGSPNAPQFHLLITPKRNPSSSSSSSTAASRTARSRERCWANVTATIEMAIGPLSSPGSPAALPSTGAGGIRFFVAEATRGDPAFSTSTGALAVEKVPRLKGYFPTGDEQLFIERKIQQQRLKRKALAVPVLLEKKKENSSSSDDEDDDDKNIREAAASATPAPWRSAAARDGSPSSHLLLGGHGKSGAIISDTAISREAHLLLPCESGHPHQRIWRSPFMTATSMTAPSIEGITLLSADQLSSQQQHLFRILACTTERSVDCSVHLSIKLFPEPSSSNSNTITQEEFLANFDVQFAAAEHLPVKVQPRDFVECFPSSSSAAQSAAVSTARSLSSTHVIYDNIVCRSFYRVDEARAIVDKINAACEAAAALTEQQNRAVARQYSSSSSPSNSPTKQQQQQQQQQKQIVFHDPEFPPFTHRSINGTREQQNNSNNNSPSRQNSSSIRLEHLDEKWLRPCELSARPCVFSSSSDKSGLPKQSSLIGNCGIVATLSAIVSAPGRLRGILHRSIYPASISSPHSSPHNNNTAFCVSFFVDGEWRAVIIDDSLPCVRGRPAFSTSTNRDEFWVLLYEKALAKAFGSYAALKGSAPMDVAFSLMSGGVGSSVYFGKEVVGEGVSSPVRRTAALLERMRAYHGHGWPMCVSSDRPGEGERIRDASGIVSNHGYAVVDIALVEDGEDDFADSSAFILLRNPWNFGCEKKRRMAERFKKSAATAAATSARRRNPDGTFWLSLSSLFSEFDYISFCRITADVLQRRFRFAVPVSESSSSSSSNCSKWTPDPTENAQTVIRLPSSPSSSSESSSGGFLRVRITVDPIGVRGGGFHLHVIPLFSSNDERFSASSLSKQQRSIELAKKQQMNRLEGVPTGEVLSTPRKDEEVMFSLLDGGQQQQQQQQDSSATKFFLTHDQVEQLQDAHTQGYFGAVFESDGSSAGSRIFRPGCEYLLLPYRVGSGFDGAFAFTVEISSSSSSGGGAAADEPLLFANLPAPSRVPFGQQLAPFGTAHFTLGCNHRSTNNPQFLLENRSTEFPVAVKLECELILPPSLFALAAKNGQDEKEARQSFFEDGLELLFLRAPSLTERDPPMLLNGRSEVEAMLIDASPFYRAGGVSLVAVLDPGCRYLVMPSRGCGTEVQVKLQVHARLTTEDAARVLHFVKL